MNKYQNGKIYKLVDNGYNKCYIGSTCETLSQRFARHRNHYKDFQKGRGKYLRSFDLFNEYDIKDCKIELLDLFPTNTRDELRKREGFHIQQEDCINTNVAGRTPKEWFKAYYNENKAQLLEKHIHYCQQNKEQLIAKGKVYRDANKERKHEADRLYRERNWDKIRQQRNAKVTCFCGRVYTQQNNSRHERTKQHQDLLNSMDKTSTTLI